MKVTEEVFKISLNDINYGDINVRKTDVKADIEELAESIEKYGLLQPIVLKGTFGNPPYEIIIGQRRFRAHEFLKQKGKLPKNKIRAVFGIGTDFEFLVASLAENIQRRDLNSSDKMEAITKLFLHFNKNVRKVAKELGISQQTVRNYIKTDEKATPKAKELLRQRKISRKEIEEAYKAAQGNNKVMDELLEEIPNLTKYERERLIIFGEKNPKVSAKVILDVSKSPKHNRTITLPLSDAIAEALEKASSKMYLEQEYIALTALEDWLKKNSFLKE